MAETTEDSAADPGPAASRQKSCDACVKSKRRCDKRMPGCRRCARKGMLCVYPKRTLESTASSAQQRPGSAIPSSDNPYTEPFNFAQPLEASLDQPSSSDRLNYGFIDPAQPAAAPGSFTSMSASSSANIPVDPWLKFITTAEGEFFDKDGWFAAEVPGLDALTPFRHAPVQEPIPCEVQDTKMSDLCIHFEPWQLYDPSTKVHHVTNAIKAFHAAFARANRTPFLHAHLYRDFMPQTILQCFAASAAYAGQTPATRAVVLRTLQRSVDDLKQGTLSSLPASAPLEKIARAQALLLYQTVRVFDGDVSLRAQAEADMPLLEERLGQLTGCRDNLGLVWNLNDDALRTSKPESWERWLFTESVRRTTLIGYVFVTLYKLMIGKSPDSLLEPWKIAHRWTLSRHLWEADSSFDFYREWNSRPQYLTDTFHLEKFLRRGSADDVDDFAQIMMVLCVGVDGTKQFLGNSSGKT